jgi:regulatory protein
MKRGVDRKISESLLNNLDRNSSFESAFELAGKKYTQLKDRGFDNSKIRNKLYAFLLSRGFESDFILKIINEIEPEKN